MRIQIFTMLCIGTLVSTFVNADKLGRSAIWNRRTRVSNDAVIALVERMHHQSFVERKGAPPPVKVSLGMRVFEGDAVSTPAGAKLHIRYKDATYIELAENSKFQVERIRFKPLNPLKPNHNSDQFDESIFRYYKGVVHVFADQIHELQHFVVKTSTAVIQALEPSEFYVIEKEKGAIEVKVKKGQIFLLNTVTNENTKISSQMTGVIKSSGLVAIGENFSEDEEKVLTGKTGI